MFGFSTSITSLQANQVAINTIANNIANANTPGYHRQQVQLSDRDSYFLGGFHVGSGVQVGSISRAFNSIVETTLLENSSQLSSTSTLLTNFRQIETIIGPGEGSIHERIEGFFNDLQNLATEPDDINTRLIALRKLGALTNEFNVVHSRLNRTEATIDRQIDNDIAEVNRQFTELFDLNRRIKIERQTGKEPNDLLDQFQQKVQQVSQIIDLTTLPTEDGGFAFQFGGGSFYFDSSSFSLEVNNTESGTSIQIAGSNTAISFTSGRVAALQSLTNEHLPQIQDQLATLARDFAFELDRIHSTGIGLDNGFHVLNSTRQLTSSTLPISEVTPFQNLQAGSVFVSVSDSATGERTLHEISFDPTSESLEDFAAKIDGIANLQTHVTGDPSSLNIVAADGYRFDFAGRVQTNPDTSNISGTSQPTAEGAYTGEQNDVFTYRVVGSGTIGVTDDLRLEVTDSSGETVGSFEIGADYEPGSPIPIKDGVSIRLGTGTVNDGDEFSTKVVSEPDETGVLAAIGLNSLFRGSNPADLEVNPQVLGDPSQFALGRNGNSGDSANIQRFLAAREASLVDHGSQPFEKYMEQINVRVAQEVSTLSVEQSSLQIVDQQLLQQQSSISGVDPNEEMVHLLEYQRSYEASVRVISAIDQVLAELFSIIR